MKARHISETGGQAPMASAMRKMAVYLGLVEDDRYDDEYDDYDESSERPVDRPADRVADRPVDRGTDRRVDRREDRGQEPGAGMAPPAQRGTVSPLADRRPVTSAVASVATVEPYRITTLHPRTYNEARTIGEHFRDGTPVIMNLTDMDDVDAKRLVDFAAGLVFGLHGTIERVTQKVFLLSPANVDVTAEDKARIAEGGFFNQS
jgi:cell division inhibitor SepF